MKRLVCLVMTFVFAILYIPAIGETKKLSGYEAFEDTAPVFAKFLLSQKWNFDFERSTVKKMYDEKENTIYLDFYIDCDLKSLKASCSGFVYSKESLNQIATDIYSQMQSLFSELDLETPKVVMNIISKDGFLVETHTPKDSVTYLHNEQSPVYTKCNEIVYEYDTSPITKSGLNEMEIKRIDDVFQSFLRLLKLNGAVVLSGFFSKETGGFVEKLSLLESTSKYDPHLFSEVISKINQPTTDFKNLLEERLGTKEIDFYEVIITKDKKVYALYKNGEKADPVNCSLGHYYPKENGLGKCMICGTPDMNTYAYSGSTSGNINESFSPSVGSSYSSSISEDYKSGLFVYAKELVSTHLKSPSIAKFPSYSECSYQKGEDGVYMVAGYVDSQNSFGAMMRENWGCMIQEVGTKWKVVMVQIGDNVYFD